MAEVLEEQGELPIKGALDLGRNAVLAPNEALGELGAHQDAVGFFPRFLTSA